jgi:predicted DNA-binding protein
MKKKKSTPTPRIALYLRPDQVKSLTELHDETGAPVSELIRRAIDAYLKERGK